MSTAPITVEQGIQTAGVGKFQYRLFLIFGLVWMADAMQVMALGLLRGMQDTRVPMIMATVRYWVIGMPAGYFLGFTLGLGGGGLWLGLVIGLTVAAVTMMWRFWRRA